MDTYAVLLSPVEDRPFMSLGILLCSCNALVLGVMEGDTTQGSEPLGGHLVSYSASASLPLWQSYFISMSRY